MGIFQRIRMIMNSGSIPGYFLQVIPITAIVAIIYCVIRRLSLKKKKEKIVWAKEIVRLISVCYVTGLFNLVVLPANFWLRFMDGIVFGWWKEILPVFSLGEINLNPSVIRWMTGELSVGTWVRHMLIGNVALFLPFGFLLPFVTEKMRIKNIWTIAVVVPLIMELLQLIFGRSLDIDDLICNFAGMVAGFYIAVLIKYLFKSKRKSGRICQEAPPDRDQGISKP